MFGYLSYGLLIWTTERRYCCLSSSLWLYIILNAAAALIPLGGSAFMADIDIIVSSWSSGSVSSKALLFDFLYLFFP